MASRTGVSRLTEILNSTGGGGFGSIAGAIGGRAREIADIRGLLFGRQGTNSTGLGQSLGRAIFGAGYSATSARSPRRLTPAVTGAGGESSSKVEDLLGQANSKLKIIARTTIAQNQMNRDVNIIRQNVVLMTKKMTGKSKTSTDGYFYDAKQREADYERQYSKSESERNPTPPAGPAAPAAPTRNGFGLGSVLKAVGGISAIFLALKNIDTIVNTFKNLNEKIKGWKDTWDKFDLSQWFKDITPEWLGTQINRMTNFINGIGENLDIAGLIDKIPAKELGELISAMASSFMRMAKAVGKKLIDAVATMDSDDLLTLGAATGIYALLTGPTGLISTLLKGIFSAIGKLVLGAVSIIGGPALAAIILGGIFGVAVGTKIKEYLDEVIYGGKSVFTTKTVPTPADAERESVDSNFNNNKFAEQVDKSELFKFKTKDELIADVAKMSKYELAVALKKIKAYNEMPTGTDRDNLGMKLTDPYGMGLFKPNTIPVATPGGLWATSANTSPVAENKPAAANMANSPRRVTSTMETQSDIFEQDVQDKIDSLKDENNKSMESYIFKKFAEAGFSDRQALGAVANAARESSFNPEATGDNGNSIGLFQFNFKSGAGTDYLGETIGGVDISQDKSVAKRQFKDPDVNIAAMIDMANKNGYKNQSPDDYLKASNWFTKELERPSRENVVRAASQAVNYITDNPSNVMADSVTRPFNLPDLFNSAGDLSEQMITIINNITNSAGDKGREAINDLSSMDMDTFKDMLNPTLMKYTLSYF